MPRAAPSPPRRWLPLAAASVVLGLDQLAKQAVEQALGPAAARHRIELLDGALALHYVENRGAAFGLFPGQGHLLAVIALGVVLALVVFSLRGSELSRGAVLGTGLLIGGALGNLLDRLRLGFVIDFIAVGPWPKFNVADSAITVGVALLALGAVFVEPTSEEGHPERARPLTAAPGRGDRHER